MDYLNKLLSVVKNDAAIFKNKNMHFIFGLTTTQIKTLKKEAIEKGLLQEKKKELLFNRKWRTVFKR